VVTRGPRTRRSSWSILMIEALSAAVLPIIAPEVLCSTKMRTSTHVLKIGNWYLHWYESSLALLPKRLITGQRTIHIVASQRRYLLSSRHDGAVSMAITGDPNVPPIAGL
jgi:hypothetical protein